MIYNIRHRTTYSYERAVTFARCVLRLRPESTQAQSLLDHTVTLKPEPSEILERIGPFGEQTLTVVIDKPHRTLVVEALSKVDVRRQPVTAPLDSPAWEEIRAASFDISRMGPLSPADYIFPTRRTQLVPAITEYGRPEYDKLIADNPTEVPLDAKALVAAFDKWDREVGGSKVKGQ